MLIEYRTYHGRRLENFGNANVLQGTGPVNLRSLGCPDNIARKVENAQILRRAGLAMYVGTEAPAVVTDADRRAKAARIADQIAEDDRKFQANSELKNRLQAAAGITHGRR
jgi:hypothetical protein